MDLGDFVAGVGVGIAIGLGFPPGITLGVALVVCVYQIYRFVEAIFNYRR